MSSTAHRTADDITRHFPGLKTPADKALLARITRFFADAIKGLTPADKTVALQAEKDILAVIETVARRPAEESPEYLVKLRGAIQKQKILEDEGGVIGPSEVAKLLGISRQAVSQRRAAGKLLAVPIAGSFAYPVWQFRETETIDGLEQVLSEIAEHDAWMQMVFFLNNSLALNGQRPLDALRQGKLPQVLRAAALYLQQSAV